MSKRSNPTKTIALLVLGVADLFVWSLFTWWSWNWWAVAAGARHIDLLTAAGIGFAVSAITKEYPGGRVDIDSMHCALWDLSLGLVSLATLGILGLAR